MQRVRAAAVAGSFYPAEPDRLGALLDECFTIHPLGPRGKNRRSFLLGGMVPHAGYVYSGPCAAHFYSGLERDTACVILLGVNHRAKGSRAALTTADYWETPLGKVQVDRELQRGLQAQIDFVSEDERPYLKEHSIEVQLPFLQRVLRDFAFIPLSLSHLPEAECAALGAAVARVYEANRAARKKTIVIASSDLSHYLSPAETEKLDQLVLDQVVALNPSGLLKIVEKAEISMCGVAPTAVLLFAARNLGARRARLLKHYHSGDAAPMDEDFVHGPA